uniref:hypothetical protein n=1 Tax=Microcoleus sp. LEGE 07076 TaxID=915322 RepID=UPI00188223EB
IWQRRTEKLGATTQQTVGCVAFYHQELSCKIWQRRTEKLGATTQQTVGCVAFYHQELSCKIWQRRTEKLGATTQQTVGCVAFYHQELSCKIWQRRTEKLGATNQQTGFLTNLCTAMKSFRKNPISHRKFRFTSTVNCLSGTFILQSKIPNPKSKID